VTEGSGQGGGQFRPLEPPGAPAPPLKATAGRAPGPRGLASRVPRWAWVAVAVAAVVVFGLWFFLLRDTGNPFAGTWTATESPISRVVISGPGRHIEATFTGNGASGVAQTFTVAAHKDGEDLVVTADDFAAAAGDAATAMQVRDTFAAIVKDFRLVFTRRDAAHLTLTVEGTFIGVIKVSLAERSIVLTKVD
jgi:hypothetical protein